MGVHLGYEKNAVSGNISGNSRNGKYSKKIKPSTVNLLLDVPRDRTGVYKDKKEFTADVENIYNAPNKEVVANEQDNLERKWGKKDPYAILS